MKIINYLILDQGHCEEAFKLYQKVLGGDLQTTRFSTLGMKSPDGRDYILHNHLISQGIELMGSDNAPEYPYHKGNALALYLIFPSVEEATAAIEKFGDKAEALIPFVSNPQLEGYAYLKDIYGYCWHITVRSGMRLAMPYLVPEARKALDLLPAYHQILGGSLDTLRFSDIDPNYPNGENLIAMATLSNNGQPAFILSDSTPDESEAKIGTNFSLSIVVDALADGQTFFDQLSSGGEVAIPFAASDWSAGYAMFTDRFGIHWQINVL